MTIDDILIQCVTKNIKDARNAGINQLQSNIDIFDAHDEFNTYIER